MGLGCIIWNSQKVNYNYVLRKKIVFSHALHPNDSLPTSTPPSSPLTLLLFRFTLVLFCLEKSRRVNSTNQNITTQGKSPHNNDVGFPSVCLNSIGYGIKFWPTARQNWVRWKFQADREGKMAESEGFHIAARGEHLPTCWYW